MRIAWLALIGTLGCGGGSSDPIDARPPVPDAPPGIDAAGPDGGTASIPETLPDPLPSGTVDLKVATFNAGLIAVVKGSQERIPLQITELKTLDADVICLQEIFKVETSPPAYAAMLADTYPYHYYSWSGQYVQGNGLLIVSKHPLYQGREFYYTMGNGGPTVDRMILGVHVVDKDDAWHAKVMCTHMHAGLKAGDLPVKLDQANELNAWAATEGYTTGPTFLLGDFNAGPIPPSADPCECSTDGDADAGVCTTCDPSDLATWNKIREVFTDPFPESADFFTSGREQFLQLAVVPGLFPDEPSQRIDHCMYTDIGAASFKAGGSGLIMDAPQSITVGADTLEYLSDHYGVICEFGP